MDVTEHVAFFRNLNQGHRGHPSTADLVEAFAAAGVREAVPFRSNGTVVFSTADPHRVAEGALVWLRSHSRYEGTVFTKSVAFIAGVTDQHSGAEDAQRRELTIFAEDSVIDDAQQAAREARDRRCEITDHGPGWAVVVNFFDRQSNGTPTIEALINGPATSRGVPTLSGLVDRWGR